MNGALAACLVAAVVKTKQMIPIHASRARAFDHAVMVVMVPEIPRSW